MFIFYVQQNTIFGLPAHNVKLNLPVHAQETFCIPTDPLWPWEQESQKPEEVSGPQGRKMAYLTPFPLKSPSSGEGTGCKAPTFGKWQTVPS